MHRLANRPESTSCPWQPPLRREQALEVGVFLFLVVPSMLLSLLVVQQVNLSFSLLAISTIFRDLGLVGLILFFTWRNGEPVWRIGWTTRNVGRDVLLGVLLFVPTFVVTGSLDQWLRQLGLSGPAEPRPSFLAITGSWQVVLAILLVVVVALAEETIFRGYLILRFENVLGSTAIAVLLSAVIFSLGHGYEGEAGVVTVGAMGIIFALVYIWRRSLVAPITMHFLQDFLAIVLLPLLTGK